MSGPSRLPGMDALQSPNLTQWSARMEAAHAARSEAEVQQAAAALTKAGAESAEAKGADPKQVAKLRQVSQDFESLFLAYMLKTMKAAIPHSDFLGQSQGEQIFSEMKDEELAKGMAKAGGIGLSKLLEQQLMQSLKSPAAVAINELNKAE